MLLSHLSSSQFHPLVLSHRVCGLITQRIYVLAKPWAGFSMSCTHHVAERDEWWLTISTCFGIYHCLPQEGVLDGVLDFPTTYSYCRAYNSSYQDQQAAGGRGRGSGARGRQAASGSPARVTAPSPDRASPMYGRGAGRGAAQRRGNSYPRWVCLFQMQQAHAKTYARIVYGWLTHCPSQLHYAKEQVED